MPRFNPDDYRGLTQEAPHWSGSIVGSLFGPALQFVAAGAVAFGIVYLATAPVTSLLAGIWRATTPTPLRSAAQGPNPATRVPSAREAIRRNVAEREGLQRRAPRVEERPLAPHEVRFLVQLRDERQFQYEMIVHGAGVTMTDPALLVEPVPGDPPLTYAIEVSRRVRALTNEPCDGPNRRLAAANVNRFLDWFVNHSDRRPRADAIFDTPDGRIIRDILIDRAETGRMSLEDFGLVPPIPIRNFYRTVRARPLNCPQR